MCALIAFLEEEGVVDGCSGEENERVCVPAFRVHEREQAGLCLHSVCVLTLVASGYVSG